MKIITNVLLTLSILLFVEARYNQNVATSVPVITGTFLFITACLLDETIIYHFHNKIQKLRQKVIDLKKDIDVNRMS